MSTNDHRRRELGDSLRRHFGEDTVGFSEAERLRWLFEHLDDYLGRWTGFCAIERISVAGVISGDLHSMLLAASKLIEEQLAGIEDETLRALWHDFVEYLRRIDGNSEKRSGEEMQVRLDRVRSIFEGRC